MEADVSDVLKDQLQGWDMGFQGSANEAGAPTRFCSCFQDTLQFAMHINLCMQYSMSLGSAPDYYYEQEILLIFGMDFASEMLKFHKIRENF